MSTKSLESATDVARAAFAAVLGLPVEDLADDDDFFALGGHSLAALAVVVRIEEETGVELSLGSFVEQATIAAVAAAVTGGRSDELP
jgi:acyl carrier protein